MIDRFVTIEPSRPKGHRIIILQDTLGLDICPLHTTCMFCSDTWCWSAIHELPTTGDTPLVAHPCVSVIASYNTEPYVVCHKQSRRYAPEDA